VWGAYAGASLREALDSLVAQDLRGRIVVVDNASETAIEVGEGIELVRAPERLTLGAARNLGLSHVATPFVLVWDADDVMLPGTLSFLVDRIQDFVAFGAGIVDDATGQRYRWPRRWTARLHRYPRLFALLQSVWSSYPTTGATLMRTERVRAAGGYSDEVSASDWGLGAALAFRGRLGWDERPGRIYRKHPESVWAQNSDVGRMLAHARAVRRRLRRDRGVPVWARALLPLVALAQYAALVVARPPLLLARKLRRRRTRTS
jgi:hypothetical protein